MQTQPQSGDASTHPSNIWRRVTLFWVSYVALGLTIGLATSWTLGDGLEKHTTWGLVTAAGLIWLTRALERKDGTLRVTSPLGANGWIMFLLGSGLGLVCFVIHASVVHTFAGPLRIEVVAGIGITAVAFAFLRYVATSCMEELGFRGYPLRLLHSRFGPWPAVFITTVMFGLSHLLYGWDLSTIVIGVMPQGIMWGMCAVATRGVAMPIGLHAAWNFSSWAAGEKPTPGLFRLTFDDASKQPDSVVGMISYLGIIAILTAGFWFLHRHRERQGPLG